MSGATATFLRGLEEVRPGAGELAVDLEAGYLAAAMHAPERATEAHRRADLIIAEERRETPAERALLCNAMMLGFFAGRPRSEALAVVRRLYAGGALVDGFHDDPTTLIQVIGVLSWSDEHDEAAEALRQAFAVARRDGSVFRFAMASQVRARQLVRTGPIGDAVEDARTAVDAWRGGQQAYLHAASHCLVVALLESDRVGDAAAVLASTDDDGARSVSAWRHMALGLVAVHEERHEDALDAFLAAGRRLDALLVTNPTVIPWRSQAGLIARRLGRDAQARELIDEEVALARGYGASYAIGIARTAAALLERGEESVGRLRDAAALLAGAGTPVAHARTLAHLGAAIRRDGRQVEARDVLREAVAVADGVGAVAVARTAREELRLAGGRAPAASAGDGLTPSERRVAERAAEGESNRDIAADALPHGQVRRVAPGQHVPQARHPRPGRARRVPARPVRRTPGSDPGGGPGDTRHAGREAVHPPTKEHRHATCTAEGADRPGPRDQRAVPAQAGRRPHQDPRREGARLVLICSRTGRVLGAGDRLRALTRSGFTEGVLETVTIRGNVRVRCGGDVHEVAFDDVEAVWPLV